MSTAFATVSQRVCRSGAAFGVEKRGQKSDSAKCERDEIDGRADRRLVKRRVIVFFDVDRFEREKLHAESFAEHSDRGRQVNEHDDRAGHEKRQKTGETDPVAFRKHERREQNERRESADQKIENARIEAHRKRREVFRFILVFDQSVFFEFENFFIVVGSDA